MNGKHKHIVRRLLTRRRVKTCQLCGWKGQNLDQHLAEEHRSPLVRLGQGSFERRIG